MYSQSKKATKWQGLIAAILIGTSVFFFTPKAADGVVLILLAGTAASVTIAGVIAAIIVDGVILCAVGVICGSSQNNAATGCNEVMGAICESTATNYCGDTASGTIQCDGTCSAGVPSDYTGTCNSAGNFCGMTGTGNLRCDSNCMNAVVPPDTSCSGMPLNDPDSLIIVPELVNEDDNVTINWDLKANYPPNCTIAGSMANVISNTSSGGTYSANNTVFTFGSDQSGPNSYSDSTGSMVIRVTGPHRYVLECGADTVTNQMRLLPVIFES